MRGRFAARVLGVAVVLTMVTVACSSGGSSSGSSTGSSGQPHTGGQAVFGAEQWPQCLNPITSCSFASWYFYTIQEQVMPQMMRLSVDNKFEASPLLTEAPSLDNGEVKQVGKGMQVTYHLNPDAVWADGKPITSEDVDFTWKAIMNTVGTVSTSGYDQITSIDTSDPETAVIHFKTVYVDWPDLFGGNLGYVIEKAAFPDANPDKPDLSKDMATDVPFSGGPWILKSWDKSQAVLVRNDKYWGDKALLDQVTFVRRQNQSTEINSILTGEVDAIFPQPSNVSLLQQFSSNPNVKSVGGPSNYYEALHMNNADPLFKDPKVREAMLYATDRQSVVNVIIKLNNPQATVLNCLGWWIPENCHPDFAQFTYQPDKAMQILESDGYDCSGVASGGFCQKNGQDLTVSYLSTAGNDRRADTAALLKEKYKAAGINLDVKFIDPTALFSNNLPKGDFQLTEYALGGSPDPTVTTLYACDQQPTPQNGYSGQNQDHWCNQAATKLMYQSDAELDPTKRNAEIAKIGQYVAQDFVGIPMYILPDVSAWRTDKIAGPIGVYNSSGYGLYYNMNKWYTVGSSS
jgi:ABC-type transport system substrate-binding protein